MSLSLVLAALALQSQPAPRAALGAPVPIAERALAPAEAEGSVEIGGRTVRYRARWAETVLHDEDGRDQASLSATSYMRADADDPARRPVTFLFNGGPGASSTPLHFGAFGPRLRDGETVLPNPDSLIDVSDLVFVDPVGTGFSRPFREGGGQPYWSPSGDARAVLGLIRAWLAENGREESPVFLVGQSYGGQRIAMMAPAMHDLNLAGLVLVSPATDMSASSEARGNDLPHVFALPTMAAAALHHGRIAADGRDTAAIWEEARIFAQGDYLLALHRGALLDDAERARIAERLSALTGLDVGRIAARGIRIGTQYFLDSLREDEGLVVGRLNARVAAPRPERDSGRPPAADDPSLGLGRANFVRSPFAEAYFRDALGLIADRPYFGVTLDVNFHWNWREEDGTGLFYRNPTPSIAALMEARPGLALLVANGYFDLATPVLGQRYALAHAGIPMDRVEEVTLPGAHSPYEEPENRAALARAVRDFIARQSE